MTALPGIDSALVPALGWTLLHFLWQGTLLATALAAANMFLRGSTPRTRYAASLAALLVLLAMPLATFALIIGMGTGTAGHGGAADQGRLATGAALPALASAFLAPALSASPAGSEPIDTVLPWLVAGWALGVVALSMRTLGGWALVWRLRRSARVLPELQDDLAALARRMRLSRVVRVCESALVEVPTALGWLRPLILLPPATLLGLSRAQLELVLAHELAHIRRLDHVAALLQAVAETVLFYHPGVWWVSHRLRALREECCDDDAVAAGGDAVAYARTLATLEELRLSAPRPLLALSGGSLGERVRRLLGLAPTRVSVLSRWPLGVSMLLLAALALIAPTGLRAAAAARAKVPPKAARHTTADRHRLAVRVERIAARVDHEIARAFGSGVAGGIEGGVEGGVPGGIEGGVSDGVDGGVPGGVVGGVDPADEPPAGDGDETEDDAPVGTQRFNRAELWEMRRAGICADDIEEFEQLGYKDLPAATLIVLRAQGVDADFARELAQAGLSDLSLTALLQLRSQGVDADYVKELAQAGGRPFSTLELITLRSQGVDADDVAALKAMGHERLSVPRLTALRSQGVSADYISELQELGYRKLSMPILMALRNQGVDGDYVRSLQELGYRGLAPGMLIMLRNQGVDADYVRELQEAGHENLTAEELMRLRAQGYTPDQPAPPRKHRKEI